MRRGERIRFCGEIPFRSPRARSIPRADKKSPCPVRVGGIHPQTTEFAAVFETDFRKKRLNRKNSLRFSLRPGNLGLQETVKIRSAASRRGADVGNRACSKNPHRARDRHASPRAWRAAVLIQLFSLYLQGMLERG